MPGLVTSERAAKIYSFLARSGPCPIDALVFLFGKRTGKAVKTLVGAGYVKRVRVRGVEYAALRSQDVSAECEALGWFAVRLAEVGGWYSAEEGRAYFPRGQVLSVVVRGERLFVGKFWTNIERLKGKLLVEALEKTA